MTFAQQLKPLVERIGRGDARKGTAKAAEVCGVSQRTVQLWLSGGGNPNTATQAGALALLAKAKPVAARPAPTEIPGSAT